MSVLGAEGSSLTPGHTCGRVRRGGYFAHVFVAVVGPWVACHTFFFRILVVLAGFVRVCPGLAT